LYQNGLAFLYLTNPVFPPHSHSFTLNIHKNRMFWGDGGDPSIAQAHLSTTLPNTLG